MCQWQWIYSQIIFHSRFNFSSVLQRFIYVVGVIAVPIVVVNKVIPLMPSFRIPHINKTRSMFIQYFNFAILVYIPTIISLCNHMPQFNKTVPSCLLTHTGQQLIKISITNIYVYCIFFGYLRYKVLIYFLCGLSGINSLLAWTTLPYNSDK